MLSREGKQTDRGAVGAEFIGYNRRRREALLLQEFPHQPNCRPSVPAGLNQEIQDFALTVHGTPEIELPPSNYDDHLVQVPAFGRSWPPTLNPPRIGPTEFQDPSSNCLIRDVETTLGKQVLNVPIAQRETAIEPDGMLDDDRWKAVTTVGYLAHPETLKHRPCRSHAVNVTMPFKLRAEIVERSFAHNLDRGGMRRTWLRGRENVHKRYLLHVAGHNLSLLMRKLIGAGTPQEAVAGGYGCICVLIAPAGAVLVAQMVLIVSEDGETAFVALCFAVE